MNYGLYKNVRNASWRCLIDCGVSELPVHPVRIAEHYGVECIDTVKYLNPGEAGKIVRLKSGAVKILLRPDESTPRKRFTIMHEMGHYLLGHLGDAPMFRRGETEPDPDEYAAERFAAGVLMPACVLWGLDIHRASDIARVCNVSQKAARIRAERMAVLYQRGKFLAHPLELQVFSQFEQFIQNNKNAPR